MNPEQIRLISGDLFTADADVLIIPCSTAGTISNPFRLGLERTLGYYFKEDLGVNPAGSVIARLFQKNSKRQLVILFAVAVDGNSSSMKVIKTLAGNLLDTISSFKDVNSVAMPLIGAGAGGLGGVALYEVWFAAFVKSHLQAEISIFINDKYLYEAIQLAISADELSNFEDDFGRNILYLAEPPVLEQQLGEFYRNGIWFNHHKNAIPLVKEMLVGHVLIIKRYQQLPQGNGMVILAMGYITNNPGDGENLNVEWRFKDVRLEMRTSHGYDRQVARVGDKNGSLILQRIEDWVQSISAGAAQKQVPERAVSVRSKIASLRSDSAKGVDHLHMERDYVSFAKIIAAKDFIPPLSVALFGKWGAGKSFFMNKLSAQIEGYQGQPNYCSGVVQIHFNAWSYLDANLWASMVSRIFEGLYQYIGGLDASQVEKELIKKGLTEQLTISSDELSKIAQEKTLLSSHIGDLENRKENIRQLLEVRIAIIKEGTFKKAVMQLDESFKVSERLAGIIEKDEDIQVSLAEIKKIVPERYFENPEEAYQQAKSGYAFLREFFSPKKLVRNLVFIGLVLVLIWVMPIVVFYLLKSVNLVVLPQIQSLLFLLTLAIPTIVRSKATYRKIAPVVAAFWKIRKDYQQQVEFAKMEAVQHRQALELEIGAGQAEIKSLDMEILKAKETLVELNFRKEHAIATEALYSFIEKRCNSGEYQKHLGIVSIIRKDFEVLSSLFVDHQKETESRSADVEEQIQSFRRLFKKPLERIVLYIDDLDRCPEERVVEVLEAVNLLMAFPLFVVVVGVDPRWVKKALAIRYRQHFTEDSMNDEINTSDYLEKIFQVPFHLKQASELEVKHMLAQLIEVDDNGDAEEYGYAVDMVDKGNGLVDVDREVVPVPVASVPDQALGQQEDEMADLAKDGPYLKLSVLERELIQQMSGILGPNPRAIKRFVNIYKIVRAHEGLEYLRSDEENSFLTVMFLLAVYNGRFKKLSAALDEQIMKKSKIAGSIAKFLDRDDEDVDKLNEHRSGLYKILSAMPSGEFFLDKSLDSFHDFNVLIRRFSFTI